MKFKTASIYTFASVLVRTAAQLSLQKVIATQFGAAGLTLFAHFQNLISFLFIVSNEGLNKGLMQEVAAKRKETLVPSVWKFREFNFLDIPIFFQTLTLQILLWIVFLVFLLIGKDFFLTHFFIHKPTAPSFWLWFVLLGLGLLLQMLLLQGLAFWAAQENFAWHSLFSAAANLLALGIVLLFTFVFHTKITLILVIWSLANGFLGLWVWLLIIAQILSKKTKLKNLYKKKYNLQAIFFNDLKYFELFKYAFAAISVVLADKMVAFFIRDWAIETFDPLSVGQWQTLLKLSDNYGAVFSATFLVIFFPKITQRLHQEKKIGSFFLKNYAFLLTVISIGLFLVYFQYQNIVLLLFEKSLIAPASWLGYWLLGDFFRLQNYTLSQFFLAQKHLKIYGILQFVFGLFFMIVLKISYHFQLQSDGILLLLQARLASYAFSVLVLGSGVFYSLKKSLYRPTERSKDPN